MKKKDAPLSVHITKKASHSDTSRIMCSTDKKANYNGWDMSAWLEISQLRFATAKKTMAKDSEVPKII